MKLFSHRWKTYTFDEMVATNSHDEEVIDFLQTAKPGDRFNLDLECLCDLPDDETIHWVWMKFDREIHAGCNGFTEFHNAFACGSTPEQAMERTVAHYKTKYDLNTVRATATPAVNQNIKSYTFPEQIITGGSIK